MKVTDKFKDPIENNYEVNSIKNLNWNTNPFNYANY